MSDDNQAEAKARLERLLASPDTLDTIFDNVASGGSLIDLVKAWGVNYGKLARWLFGDPERLKRYQEALQAREDWAKEAIIHEMTQIGMQDIRRLYAENGELLPVDRWPDDIARAVASIEVLEKQGAHGYSEGTITKVKLHNKVQALHLAGKDVGKFVDRTEHSGTIKLDEVIGGSIAADDPLNKPKK